MHNITLQPACARRRAPFNESRGKDARVSPAPVARANAKDASAMHVLYHSVDLGSSMQFSGVHTGPRGAVGPPTAAPEILPPVSCNPRGPAKKNEPTVAGFIFAEAPESHPIELSDLSGNESDSTTDTCQPPTVLAPAKQNISSIKGRRGENSRHPPASNLHSATQEAAESQGALLQTTRRQRPDRCTTARAAKEKRGRSVLALSALLSMLVVLVAVASSNRTLAAVLSRGSGLSAASAGGSSSSSHDSSSILAAAAAAPQSPTLIKAWTMVGSFLRASHKAAWTATKRVGLQHGSSSRSLVRASAMSGSQLAAGQWRQISGVLSRMKPSLGLAQSMHSGSSSRTGSAAGNDGATAVPAAVSGDGAAAAAAALSQSPAADAVAEQQAVVAGAIQMYAVVDDSAVSPYKGATWGEVVRHIAKRLQWSDERFILSVITQQQLNNDVAVRDRLSHSLGSTNGKTSPVFVGIAVTNPQVVDYLKSVTANLPTALFWDSAEDLNRSSRVDGYAPASAGPVAQLLAQHVGFSGEARAANVLKTIDSLWSRHTSDDLLFIWLVLLNEYVTPVPEVANTTKGTDLQSLYCMIKNCGQKIVDCVTDTTCKKGLDCLDGCAFNDQVCQYRCIVSYETPKFEQFALCILQLHNCRGLDAEMPTAPDPAPMTSWRGQPMTHELGESLFIGWKDQGPQMPEGSAVKPYSWLVAAGKNPAYDYFPCQHQLYSYGKGKGQMWYEPVFKAITLDGHEVWRRRRYRVRRGSTPGTFYYSVLDNGVTSNEYWRILDCAEDLTYCLFYYSGAAATAGLSYSGAVLGTADGSWPEAHTDRIHAALRTAGIEPWELSSVDNSQCVGAPL